MNQKNKTEKITCPFCGKKSALVAEHVVFANPQGPIPTGFYVLCRNKKCLSHGPLRKTAKGAEKAWKKVKSCEK